MQNDERVISVLKGLCFNIHILEHDRISDADREEIRKTVEYLYTRADDLKIPFRVQNEATKAGHDNDLRVVYLSDAMKPVYECLARFQKAEETNGSENNQTFAE